MEPAQIYGCNVGHRFDHDFSLVLEHIQALVGRIRVHSDQLGGGGGELFTGKKTVSVVQIVSDLVDQRRGDTLGTVLLEAQGERQSVGFVKASSHPFGGDQVRIGPHHFHGRVAVQPVKTHGVFRSEPVGGEKLHQPAHPGLGPIGLADLSGFAEADPLHAGQTFGLLGEHLQRFRAERVDQQRRRGRTDAFDGAGSQVFVYMMFTHGQTAPRGARLELLPVAGMALPHAVHGQPLPGGGKGHASHHDDGFVAAHVQTKHGVSAAPHP